MNKITLFLFSCLVLLNSTTSSTQKSSLENAVDQYNIEEVMKIASSNYRINKRYKESILQALELAEKNKLSLVQNPLYWGWLSTRLGDLAAAALYSFFAYGNICLAIELSEKHKLINFTTGLPHFSQNKDLFTAIKNLPTFINWTITTQIKKSADQIEQEKKIIMGQECFLAGATSLAAIGLLCSASKSFFNFLLPIKELREKLQAIEIIRNYLENILAIIQQEEQRKAQVY